MRIGFDVTPLRAPHGGVSTYTSSLLNELSRSAGDEIVRMDSRINKTLWMQALLPLHLRRLAADVCHFTNNVAPWWTPCPSVLTIHDTTLWMLPHYHPRRRLLAMRPFIPLAARRASAIIAVSASTKRDVVRVLGVPDNKVHVIHEAPAPHFSELPATAPTLQRVRARYGLPDRFVLYVGTIEPRKNLLRLLQAFAILRRDGQHAYGLVLVGNRGWHDLDVFSGIERLGLAASVRVVGFAPSDDLVALYNLADVVAFPSLYEGFGLPVVEAMACGTPVVTSPNGSLAEIADGAAELVEPKSVESIAAGLQHVLMDADRRAQLRAAGLERAAQFSWRTAAAQTRQVYRSVIAG